MSTDREDGESRAETAERKAFIFSPDIAAVAYELMDFICREFESVSRKLYASQSVEEAECFPGISEPVVSNFLARVRREINPDDSIDMIVSLIETTLIPIEIDDIVDPEMLETIQSALIKGKVQMGAALFRQETTSIDINLTNQHVTPEITSLVLIDDLPIYVISEVKKPKTLAEVADSSFDLLDALELELTDASELAAKFTAQDELQLDEAGCKKQMIRALDVFGMSLSKNSMDLLGR